jgi:hypothetical protein
MKIPTFDDLKRAVAALVHTREAKRPGNSSSRLIWPLALACGFLIFATASSIYRVRSSQASGDLVK